ncbi:LysR family transcriptional regulator [Curvivirga aplysinae]|uniref:LysR family transcriptional regulator n=1 Tax=Curvivirga aplysinae TaxID=2529852 RepID=UPI0012BD2A1D|nr:LysR family transcriptional regulator [Curvivirga aplysinae]MTI10171.1 LysR family transcriptional regulator [Curvivirga aplysinae]
MLERTHLNILRELDRCGTLTETADKLCLTQSALSHTIKKLELQIGTPVWTKEGRQLMLTPVGQYLLNMANRILPQFEHAENLMRQFADGQRGTLRIGMECHPCYRWLLTVVSPYLSDWPDVDVDVKQAFQFGGMAALFGYDIDVLITPDPLFQAGVTFTPVFDYEQVLVVSAKHRLAKNEYIEAQDLIDQILITYPVEADRLDIFNSFLLPANCRPKQHKTLEATDIIMEMIAAQRGVGAFPYWLVEQYSQKIDIVPIRLGETGIHKKIHLGIRENDMDVDYIKGFIKMAQSS